MLDPPGSEHRHTHRATDRWAPMSGRPHLAATRDRGGGGPSRSHRRRGLWPGEGDQRAPHPRANPTVPVAWAMELGKPAAAVHGGAAARVIAGGASPATARWEEVLEILGDAVRCSCARKEGGRENRAGLSTLSQAPARRSSLRRGILGR